MEDISLKETISRIEKLKEQYKDECIIRKNGTLLLGPDKIPKCQHMLFRPLQYKSIDKFIIQKYKHHMPKEYVDFLQYSNGANLFYLRLNSKKFTFASLILSVFGLPRNAPFTRPLDEEEPYDIRIESLSFSENLPQTWLKCARYIKDYNFYEPCEVFIDTLTDKVYGCKKESDIIVDSWSTLDECFSSIMDSAKDMKPEYSFKSKYD